MSRPAGRGERYPIGESAIRSAIGGAHASGEEGMSRATKSAAGWKSEPTADPRSDVTIHLA